MAETSFRLVNGAEIAEKMKRIGPLAVKAVRSEFIRIGNDLVKTARQNHRFKNQSNQLENSIQYKVAGDGMKLEFNAGVSLAQEYASYVHDGTKPHKITASGRALAFDVGGGTVLRKSVQHPGTAPDPFMQTAWDEIAPTMAGRLEAAIGRAIGADGNTSVEKTVYTGVRGGRYTLTASGKKAYI